MSREAKQSTAAADGKVLGEAEKAVDALKWKRGSDALYPTDCRTVLC